MEFEVDMDLDFDSDRPISLETSESDKIENSQWSFWVTDFEQADGGFEYSVNCSLISPPKHAVKINGVNQGYWSAPDIAKWFLQRRYEVPIRFMIYIKDIIKSPIVCRKTDRGPSGYLIYNNYGFLIYEILDSVPEIGQNLFSIRSAKTSTDKEIPMQMTGKDVAGWLQKNNYNVPEHF